MRRPLSILLLVGALCAQRSAAQQPVGEVQGPDASVRGAVTVSANGTMVMSGSQITAGDNAANIKLARGGELKVCPRSSIAITASANGREALVGVSSGSVETRYRLGSSADTILTPDFRISLPGPGDFHFAIGMKPSGDMCVKSLPGNSAALVVNEVFGDGTHQVKPGEALLFAHGTVQGVAALNEDCGCPSAAKPAELGFPEKQSQQAAVAIAAGQPPQASEPLPGVAAVTTKKDEVITQVDAPIVFHGQPPKKPEPAKSEVTPATGAPAASAPASPERAEAKPAETAPKLEPKPAKKKWYQKLGSALASIFR